MANRLTAKSQADAMFKELKSKVDDERLRIIGQSSRILRKAKTALDDLAAQAKKRPGAQIRKSVHFDGSNLVSVIYLRMSKPQFASLKNVFRLKRSEVLKEDGNSVSSISFAYSKPDVDYEFLAAERDEVFIDDAFQAELRAKSRSQSEVPDSVIEPIISGFRKHLRSAR